jgi:hypothetical protein
LRGHLDPHRVCRAATVVTPRAKANNDSLKTIDHSRLVVATIRGNLACKKAAA